MIQNNNTKDVAYLGFTNFTLTKQMIDCIVKCADVNCPKTRNHLHIESELIFDCSGTRYGFRIKELKS